MPDFDPLSAEVLRDPYPFYRVLRDESPCYYVRPRGFWVVTRYEDVVASLRNHAVFSSTGGVGYHWEQRPMMPMYDPPQHTRMRRLVSRAFQPTAIAQWTAQIETTFQQLLDRALEAGRVDIITDLAVPLSLGTIGDILGMPAERRDDLRRWSKGVVDELAGGLDREARANVETLRKEFVTYLRELVAERIAKADTSATDVISVIANAHEQDALTEKETIAFCVLLLTAGYETTVNAIANGVLAFSQAPAEWARLSNEPGLVKTASDETVRYDGAVQSFFRNTLTETSIAGVRIPKGGKVQMVFASANRDERKYPAADEFRIDRVAPDHVGYGVGVHYCLGAPLARAQLTSFWAAFAKRVRNFEVTGDVVRTGNVLFRGAKQLPVTISAR